MNDHSNKSVLARGCDPVLSQWAKEHLAPQIGNPEYVPTTNDGDFVEKLKTRKWDVIYFAPGACRFSAAKMVIPGSTQDTKGWTLDEYKKLVHETQGEDVLIVESVEESESFGLLAKALDTIENG